MSDDNEFAPLSKKDRLEAMQIAGRAEVNLTLPRHQLYRLSRLLMRYENALQSVGYTDGND